MTARAENIGPRGRRRRRRTGLAALAIGVAALAALLLNGADRGLRLALVAPFWVAALGFSQARAHT